MNSMEDEERDVIIAPAIVPPASGIAWQMFTQTGLPAYYLLYRDIETGGERNARRSTDGL